MNHDTNREDRVEPEETADNIVWGCHRNYLKVCISCGSVADPYRNLPCACGKPEDRS
jgi:hypothetical protein